MKSMNHIMGLFFWANFICNSYTASHGMWYALKIKSIDRLYYRL